MVLLATKVLYYFVQNVTFVLLFTAMFEPKQKLCSIRKLLQIVVLTCIQFLCSGFLSPFFSPIALMLIFCIISEINEKRPLVSLLIEVAFGFAVQEFYCIANTMLATAVWLLFNETINIAPTLIICSITQIVTCCCSLTPFQRSNLSAISSVKGKVLIGFVAFGFSLAFGTLAFIQTPYSPENRVYFIIAFFGFIVAFVMLVFWAKVGLIIAHLNKMLEKKDDTIHDYGHALVDVHRDFKKIVVMARNANTTGEFGYGFSSELDTFTEVLDGLVGTTEPLDTDTGIANLDAIIKHAAKAAREEDIIFGCSIEDKPKMLLKEPGVTKEALLKILRNLLDNAVHAAAKSKRKPSVVHCLMGVDGANDCYRIDIYDSGEPFPPDVLRNLGRNGNTENGHGFGMVSVLRMLAQCGASIFITHFDEPLGTGATKCVTVSFDGLAMAQLPAEGGEEPLTVGISSLLNRNERKREDQTCTK